MENLYSALHPYEFLDHQPQLEQESGQAQFKKQEYPLSLCPAHVTNIINWTVHIKTLNPTEVVLFLM